MSQENVINTEQTLIHLAVRECPDDCVEFRLKINNDIFEGLLGNRSIGEYASKIIDREAFDPIQHKNNKEENTNE